MKAALITMAAIGIGVCVVAFFDTGNLLYLAAGMFGFIVAAEAVQVAGEQADEAAWHRSEHLRLVAEKRERRTCRVVAWPSVNSDTAYSKLLDEHRRAQVRIRQLEDDAAVDAELRERRFRVLAEVGS